MFFKYIYIVTIKSAFATVLSTFSRFMIKSPEICSFIILFGLSESQYFISNTIERGDGSIRWSIHY